MSTNLLSPTPYASYTAQSGNTYTATATSVVANVATGDVVDLINMGCSLYAANGLFSKFLSLFDVKLPTGLQLAATAAAGVFGLSNTAGTSLLLLAESAQNNTKTDIGDAVFILPESYTAGEDLSVTINAAYTGSGVAGTKTIDLSAYEMTKAGLAGSDLVSTAAQTLSAAAATDYTFTIDGTGLAPGDALVLKFTLVIQETGNTNPLIGNVNSIKVAQAA